MTDLSRYTDGAERTPSSAPPSSLRYREDFTHKSTYSDEAATPTISTFSAPHLKAYELEHYRKSSNSSKQAFKTPEQRPLDYRSLFTSETLADELLHTVDDLSQWLGTMEKGMSQFIAEVTTGSTVQ